MHVQVGCVDDQVGGPADGVEDRTLHLDRFDEPIGLLGQRMQTTGCVVSAYQLGGRRVEEEHGHLVAGGAQLADLGEHLDVLPAGDERQPFDVAVRLRREFDDRSDERGRQVVDDEPAEILENVGDAGPSGAGQAGDQNDVGHGATLRRGASTAT